MSEHQPVGGKLLTKPFLFFATLALIGLFVIAYRFVFGIGAVSNLSDGYPWGIWIVFDVMVGTAFGCAGYAIALTVYVLNRGKYHPLVRPAILAGLFGYTLAGLAVMVDLGRYWQFYTLLMPWYMQPNSVMLEVALCIMVYTVVLWIEFSPSFLEKFGFHDLKNKLSNVLYIFIALGLLLPTMHQSSLGTLAVVFGHQVSPLWQTQLLPLLFLLSALLMGYAIVPFEGILAALGFRRPSETPLLGRLSRYALVVLALYLVVRVADLTSRHAWVYAFEGNLNAVMFWLEMALYIVPLVLLLYRPHRTNTRMIFISAMCMLLAGTLYRVNVYLVGYHPGPDWSYFPSVPELLITVGLFSTEIVLYLIFVKHLPVPHRAEAA